MAHKSSKEVTGRNAVIRTKAPGADDLQTDMSSGHEEDEVEDDFNQDDDDSSGQQNYIPIPITLKLSRSLLRKLNDNAREEGVTMEELAAELVSEGVVIRAWEIVEKKAAMRGGNQNPNNPGNFNRQGNSAGGNQAQNGNNLSGSHSQRQFQGPGNKMAQKKLQRQARQHANAMDLMSDKAAFLEYVRNQEKKRR